MLSHCLPKQVDDFAATEFDAFDQAHDHPHVGQHRRAGQTRLVEHHPFQSQFDRRGQWRRRRAALGDVSCGSAIGLRLRGAAAWLPWRRALSRFFLRFPGGRSVVRGTPLAGTLPAMVLPAAERTTQVPPTCVPGMREKANPAVRAVSDAAREARDGTARPSPARSDIAGQAAWRGRPGANPRETRKTSRRLWQKSQTLGYNLYCFIHTLVLPPRRECFERQGEVFCARRTRIRNDRPHKRSVTYRSPRPFCLPSRRRLAARQILKPLLGRRKPSSSFQVAWQFI